MKNPDPTDLLAIALADIAKNGYSTHFLASLTLSLRTLKSLSLCRKPNVLAILYLLICLPYFLDGSAVLEKTDQRIRGVRAGENSNDHFSLQELQDAVLATLKTILAAQILSSHKRLTNADLEFCHCAPQFLVFG